MSKNLFRKASLDKINAPEQLNEYIRVASPSVWLLLGAFILFLFGFFIWSIFGTIETRRPIEVVSTNDTVECYIPAVYKNEIRLGMEVIVKEEDDTEVKGTIIQVDSLPTQLPEDADPYLLYLGNFAPGDFVYRGVANVPNLKDGTYNAEVITEQVHAVSFISH